MTSKPLVSRTLATLRSAEFGFFGVRVITWRQTPRRCGQSANAGDLDFSVLGRRPLVTSWLMVGMASEICEVPSVQKIHRDSQTGTTRRPTKLFAATFPALRSDKSYADRERLSLQGRGRRGDYRRPFPVRNWFLLISFLVRRPCLAGTASFIGTPFHQEKPDGWREARADGIPQ